MNIEQKEKLIGYLNSLQNVKGHLRTTSDDMVIWSLNKEYIIPDKDLLNLVRTHVRMTVAIYEHNAAQFAYNKALTQVYDLPLVKTMEAKLCCCETEKCYEEEIEE